MPLAAPPMAKAIFSAVVKMPEKTPSRRSPERAASWAMASGSMAWPHSREPAMVRPCTNLRSTVTARGSAGVASHQLISTSAARVEARM